MRNNTAGLLLVLTAVACGDDEPMLGRDPYRFTNLGNSVDMVGAITSRVANVSYLDERKVRLLDVNLQRQAPKHLYEAGPWCLTVTSSIIEPSPGIGIPLIPLVCDISLGSGGAAHKLTVDAMPGFALQLPVATVTVDVRWVSPLPIDPFAAPADQWELPAKVRVRGTLQRSECNSWAHRTFALNRSNVGGTVTTGDVPHFARSVFGYSVQTAQMYNMLSSLSLYEQSGPSGLAIYTGADLLAILIAGTAPVPVPGPATGWTYVVNAADATPSYVVFDIAL